MTNHATDSPQKSGTLPGTLYVVATPIGNLHDISERASQILKRADLIAAEDTRHTGLLLQSLGFKNQLVSYHQHNEAKRSAELIEKLLQGCNVALVSDAGTPAVSDPGTELVDQAHQQGIPVCPIPGSSAAIAALSASGLDSKQFQFLGFFPNKTKDRQQATEDIRNYQGASILYEAPHRIVNTANYLSEALPNQRALIARELTKRFEQIHRCTLQNLPKWLSADDNHQRGEFVIIVEGNIGQTKNTAVIDAKVVLEKCLTQLPLKAASRLAADITGEPKNELYQMGLALKGQAD